METDNVHLVIIAKEEVIEAYDNEEAAENARKEILEKYDIEPHDIQIYERRVMSE